MNLAVDLLSEGSPTVTALFAGSVEVTYSDLRDKVDRWARSLVARGGRRQDRVAIFAENGPFFVASYLAVIRAGMVAVPLQTDSSAETNAGILESAGVATILASLRYRTQVDAWAVEGGASVLAESDLDAPVRSYDGPLPEVDPARDLAALMFTSGSTGKPKGVMVTHRNIACNTRDIGNYLELSSRDRALVVLPFSYCFGLSVLHTHLAVGGSVVISNQFMYPERVLQEIEDRACTGLAGVPSTFQILLRKSRFKDSRFSSLRWLQQAGGPLPNSCIQEIVDALPEVRLYVMYGQTEATARLSYLPPERLRDKLGSVGTGLPSTKLEVVTPEGRPVTPGADEIGEIVASGENVTLGYWEDPQETAKYFRDGRLHTGDLARVDSDGFIYIVGREREIIKCGGNRVGAKEIEDVIAELEGIVEVAVVGAPHAVLGEAIVAFVETSSAAGGLSPDVLGHCQRRLNSSNIPEAVVYLGQFPRGGNGKVLKAELRNVASDLMRPGPYEATPSPLEANTLGVLKIQYKTDSAAAARR